MLMSGCEELSNVMDIQFTYEASRLSISRGINIATIKRVPREEE